MIRPILSFIPGIVLIAGACQPQRGAEPRGEGDPIGSTATAPADTMATFEGPGITLSHPADWRRQFGDDRVMYLWGSGTPSPSSIWLLSLDVPKLPPHVPGLIPLGLVVNGYVNDLKRQHAGVEVGKPVELKVAGASARRVRSRWDANGATHVEDAVLTVHGDRVYIFRANAEVPDEQAARQALDRVLESVTWK